MAHNGTKNEATFFENAEDLFNDARDIVSDTTNVLNKIGILSDTDLKKVGDAVGRVDRDIDEALKTERRRQAENYLKEFPSKMLSPTVLVPVVLGIIALIWYKRSRANA